MLHYTNSLFDKPVKGYFDQLVPEFQMNPADCLSFLDHTQRVYAEAQKMAAKIWVTLLFRIRGIFISASGRMVRTSPAAMKTDMILPTLKFSRSVAHLTKKGAFLLYPLTMGGQQHHENFLQHMRISEDKESDSAL